MQLRAYQERAVAGVLSDPRRCVLVAPTGAGKTVMGRAIAASLGRVLWVAHRDELLSQAPAECERRSVQQLLASGDRPQCDAVVWDECHHAAAGEWRTLLDAYAGVPVVGLTATPQRADGVPLGDLFTRMVVAAHYDELVESGHLVRERLYAPRRVGSGLALPIPDAVRMVGGQCVVFCSTIEEAVATGYPTVTADTPTADRRATIAAFRRGEIQTLANVYALTEGFDAPETRGVVLARGFSHASTYLQACGRALRPAPGKTEAVVVDLVGSALVHGSPTQRRAYSLDGDGIARASSQGLTQCLKCGRCYPSDGSACPECGWKQRKPWRIAQADGDGVTELARHADPLGLYRRLRAQGLSLEALATRYRRETGHLPPWDVTRAEVRAEYGRLVAAARARGHRDGAAWYRLRAIGLGGLL